MADEFPLSRTPRTSFCKSLAKVYCHEIRNVRMCLYCTNQSLMQCSSNLRMRTHLCKGTIPPLRRCIASQRYVRVMHRMD